MTGVQTCALPISSDKAFTEFCLSLPQDQYLKDGLQRRLAKRVLADRLPREVLYARHKGLQAVDWHEGLTDARPEVTAELERLTACAPAGQILDLDRLKKNAANWPTSGWETSDVVFAYRLAMLRGISAGHFLRKVSGGNQ